MPMEEVVVAQGSPVLAFYEGRQSVTACGRCEEALDLAHELEQRVAELQTAVVVLEGAVFGDGAA